MEPAFGMQVSLGLINVVVLCPALTSHSELSEPALAEAAITATTMRISVGDEDSRYLLDHFTRASALAFGDGAPEFVATFPSGEEVSEIYEEVYIDAHRRWAQSKRTTWHNTTAV
jgi:O-acetylhomoserine (thiol)-lyase